MRQQVFAIQPQFGTKVAAWPARIVLFICLSTYLFIYLFIYWIYSLNESFSNPGHKSRMIRWLVITELKRYQRTQSLLNSRYYPGIYLDGLKKTKETVNHHSRCSTEVLTGRILYTSKERRTDCSIAGDGHIITLENNHTQRCQLYGMQVKADLP
jgi:hypothetical protein